jgi:hypothetical protein
MAKTTAKSISDQFEQYANFNFDISKTNLTPTFLKIEFGVKPSDRIGIIVKDMMIEVSQLGTTFTADNDLVNFGLLDNNNVSSYSQITIQNPRVKCPMQWRNVKKGTPANQYFENNGYLYRSLRDHAGGGQLMHAAAVYMFNFAVQTTDPASDKEVYGRFAFQYVELSETDFRELWEAMYVPSTL